MKQQKKETKKDSKKVDSATISTGRANRKHDMIASISLLVIALFAVLSALQSAGVVGAFFHTSMVWMFGYGFILLPILLTTLGLMLALPSMRNRVSLKEYISSVVLLLTTLSLLDIVGVEYAGGHVGAFIAQPLLRWFAAFSVIIVLGLMVGSFYMLYQTPLRIPERMKRMFAKQAPADDVYDEDADDVEVDAEEDEEEDEAEPAPTKDRKPVMNILKKKKEEPTEETLIPEKGEPHIKKDYTYPPLSLLAQSAGKPAIGDVKANQNIIKRTLANFGIDVEMDEVSVGPTVTRYAMKPAEGVKLSRILALQNELSLALAAHPLRVEAPIPGKSLVGIEIPNRSKTMVGLGTVFAEDEFKQSSKPLLVVLGKNVTGKTYFENIAEMPHGLIAGTTGSGKSVTIHTLVVSLLYRNSPEDLRFIMVDPKRVELTLYNKIPHLLTPVIKEPKKAILALKWAAKEMDRRYNLLEEYQVRDISSYHSTIMKPAHKKAYGKNLTEEERAALPERMPYIVIIIDELADIMTAYPRELEAGIVRLAQMSRAVGIHLILSTQRPSVNVITGLIKANVPTRAALQVASQIDSRTILDTAGAEKLLGRGDMLFQSGKMSKPERVQCPYVSEDEVKRVVDFIRKNHDDDMPDEIDFGGSIDSEGTIAGGSFEDNDSSDDLYEDARQIVIESKKASTSFLQRKLGIGYARAARLIDMLEERGVVGPGNGAKPRDVLEGSVDAERAQFGDDHAV